MDLADGDYPHALVGHGRGVTMGHARLETPAISVHLSSETLCDEIESA